MSQRFGVALGRRQAEVAEPNDGRPRAELVVSDEDRATLMRWTARHTTAQNLATRARIILRCATGIPNMAVAQELGVAEALRISPARLSRACALLNADPPRGLRLEDSGERLTLVSAPACAANIERLLNKGTPEALSQAALEVLAIVAYEQPVTRADIRDPRRRFGRPR